MFVNKKILVAGMISLAAIGMSSAAFAQSALETYPSKPVTLIVPFPAGGVTDVVGREIAAKLTEALRQPVIVENRAGAGGNIGTQALARSSADGYTLGILTVSAISIAPHITKKPGFVPAKDFVPITNIVNGPGAIIASTNAPFSSLKDMVAYAKANPNKLTYASVGSGSIPHLTAEMFAKEAQIQLTHVPYKGAAPAFQDLLGGHIDLSFETSLVTASTNYAKGKIKVLATTGSTRAAALPNIPTVAESGFPGFVVQGWFGLFAPAGVPKPIVDKLNTITQDALRDPKIRTKFEQLGLQSAGSSSHHFAQFLVEQDRKWSALTKSLNIPLE
ncbi:Bug family tripartite tricarboxylate transporter substrate binding protein [Noviherbaspirillum malthae]|jgi:tripartite-type tricarboxylate transporter receptor subunit TctC|uniref:Bug family tripartite tricarboxylate transporter substrate binding protein n=1 Tax=Noviherbaspirillum malthae TaxID=1260987 RepID=UPI00188E92A9|nr:tripartite tricarboxylate transporter substrate binding protein [Noviherbaspirillum malthae]